MSDQTVNIIFQISGNANQVMNGVTQASTQLSQSLSKTVNLFNSISGKLIVFQQASQLIQGFKASLDSAIQPGIQLNTSMQDLSAITGITGKGLKEIEGYARSSAKAFGVDAAGAVESYKLVLSQLSPEIAKTPSALKAMGESISTLSKTMGGNTIAAAEVLTTAMNQFQVSTEDPIAASKEMARMMNVMAAAAKEGSAELPQIKQALEQSGMAAKAAGVSFEETNAAIQVLDKAGKKGAEGGVALRNVMNILARGRFLPKPVLDELQAAGVDINILTDKSKSLTERLRPLNEVMNDSALFSKLFGMENTNAAMALVSGIDDVDRYSGAITGTNTAYEQAEIVMESYAEKQARIKARFDDLKISVFNATGDMGIWTQVVAGALIPIAQLAPILSLGGKAFSFLKIKAISAYTQLGMYNGYLSIGKVENLGFRKNVIQSAVALVRFATVGIFNALKGLGAYALSLVTCGDLSKKFAIIGGNAFRAFSLTAKTAIASIPIVGWIAIAITAIVSFTAYLYNKFEGVRNWFDGIGSTILMLTGPLGIVINIVTSFVKHWQSIKTAFTDGGILQGIKRIGFVLIDALLKPIQALLELIAKIPGMGKIATKGANWINDMRNSLDKSTYVEPKKEEISVLGETREAAVKEDSGTEEYLSGGNLGSYAGTSAGKAQQIKIILGKMVDTINFNGGLRENAKDVESQLTEIMARILGMAETAM